ncbi:MAG: hypothetical protein R3F61_37885 [Myxococcota bacterium]
MLAALGVVGSLGLTWAARIAYPYDLEWMEGGMLAHAWRLLQGEPLYVAPGPEFVPFVYPPGYPAVVALIGSVAGLSPWVGRAVSIAGTLGAAAALGTIVARPRNDAIAGVLAAATFLGCYAHTGAFYDLVRPDGLFMGLLAGSIALALRPGRAWVGSALLLVLAFLVKHNAAFFGPALVLCVGTREGLRPALLYAALAVVPALVAVGLLQLTGDGLFVTYLVSVPRSHPLIGPRLFPGALLELAQALPLTSIAAAVWVLARGAGALPGRSRALTVGLPLVAGAGLALIAVLQPDRPVGLPTDRLSSYLGLLAAGAVAAHVAIRLGLAREARPSSEWLGLSALALTAGVTALWMRAHSGGYLNVHVPALWMAALCGGVVLSRVSGRHRPVLAGLFAAQLAWQWVQTPHDAYRPTDADRAAGDQLVETLSHVKGPVFSPYAAWLPTYAGHAPQAHAIAVMDLDIPDGPLKPGLSVFPAAFAQHHWGAVVTSQRDFGFGFSEHYQLRTKLHHPAGALAPKSGWPVRLEAIYVPD